MFCPRDGAGTIDIPGTPAEPPGAAPSAVRAPSPPPAWSAPPAAPPRPPPPADPFLGKMVGNFRLNRRIGAGGMGAVYEGVHPIVGNRIAIKVMGGNFALDRDLVDRFFSEARTLNQVHHDNIVRVIDLGAHPEGFYYCMMELLEGDTLAGLVQRGRMDQGRALGILVQSCDALAAAHEKGIVHRDLKPANIMLVRHPQTGGEMVKLVDFGIAKLQTGQSAANPTVSGTVIGTPAYMSPEQAAGRVGEIDQRSDLYSLGLVAYEMLTGHHPFEGRAVGELIVAQVTETPRPPSTLFDLPPRLDDAVMRLLRKRREERFPNATAIGQELRAIQEMLRAPPPPPPPTPEPVRAAIARAPTPPQLAPVAAPPILSPQPIRPPPSAPPPVVAMPTLAPAPTAPVAIPRREATMNPAGPGGVRLAQRQQKTPQTRARPALLLALVVSGAALGAALVGVLDAEPLVASAATALGLAPPTARARRAAPPSLDGTNGAFAASPALGACREPFANLRALPMPSSNETLEAGLNLRLKAYQQLGDCLTAARQGSPKSAQWAPPYIEGVAAFEFALSLDRLPADLKPVAQALKDGPTAPFYPELYAVQASARFGEAYPDAPEVHKGYVDNFSIELDALKRRLRAAEQAQK